MTNADEILGATDSTVDEPQTNPTTLPSVGTKAGWKTSEGQLTFLFTVAALVFSWFKIDVTSDQIHNGYQLLQNVIESVGPLIAAATALWAYIVSRGKQKSNAINATAAMMVSRPVPLSGIWGNILKVGKVAAPLLPGPAGTIASEILGSDDSGTEQYNQLVVVAKNHEGRIKALESK